MRNTDDETINHEPPQGRKSWNVTGFEKDIRIDSSSSWQQGMAASKSGETGDSSAMG
jgi:hypothetical protein